MHSNSMTQSSKPNWDRDGGEGFFSRVSSGSSSIEGGFSQSPSSRPSALSQTPAPALDSTSSSPTPGASQIRLPSLNSDLGSIPTLRRPSTPETDSTWLAPVTNANSSSRAPCSDSTAPPRLQVVGLGFVPVPYFRLNLPSWPPVSGSASRVGLGLPSWPPVSGSASCVGLSLPSRPLMSGLALGSGSFFSHHLFSLLPIPASLLHSLSLSFSQEG